MRRVLVVDDEQSTRDLLRETLLTGGKDFLVSEARNGEEAVAMTRELSPDLVLLDVVMPGQSGLSALYELKRDPETSGTKVILVSGRSSMSIVQAGLAAGASDYVVKPFVPAELMARVDRAL